ncbi:hypothetical protein B0G80_5959 [Paraburkholderia sp. BL6669N2]|uniref:hypothetical protein n=1 Tax=Paraburkholderia sp. BL6669N2 TaxID=1938807 RepID=UPI000E397F1D|nr:hypothetical protein [Paraburkholderia sp. BL6669N2]REG49577.1 hypothetical protein B0G80_5959 [Paraburkholderia sp. BL6669N2]
MRFFATILALAGLISASELAHADDALVLNFETHAAFFSAEMGLQHALDPQVFVRAADATAAIGPQGIAHEANLRNARSDDLDATPILNAKGRSLPMTLGQWLGARGTVTLTPRSDGSERIVASLAGLEPNGEYSLFENHFDQNPIAFTPLDGSARNNSFRANAKGDAVVDMVSPSTLTHDNAILLVFHSDGQAHGGARGIIGVDAHHQLIARPH